VTDTWKYKPTGKHKCLTNSTTKTLEMSLPAEKQLSANISRYHQHSADITNISRYHQNSADITNISRYHQHSADITNISRYHQHQ
jgi:hypothetical protein